MDFAILQCDGMAEWDEIGSFFAGHDAGDYGRLEDGTFLRMDITVAE